MSYFLENKKKYKKIKKKKKIKMTSNAVEIGILRVNQPLNPRFVAENIL